MTFIEDVLRRWKVFGQWPPQYLAQLAAASRVVHSERGERVILAGAPLAYTYFVCAGWLSLSQPATDHGEAGVVGMAGANMLLGSVMMEEPCIFPFESAVLKAATLIQVRTEVLRRFLDMKPELWGAMCRMLLEQSSAMLSALVGQVTGTVSQRVVQTLLQYVSLYGELAADSGAMALKMNQDDFGDLLQLSRRTISKELKGLEELGLIVRGYNAIVVPDLVALERFAEQGGAAERHGFDKNEVTLGDCPALD